MKSQALFYLKNMFATSFLSENFSVYVKETSISCGEIRKIQVIFG